MGELEEDSADEAPMLLGKTLWLVALCDSAGRPIRRVTPFMERAQAVEELKRIRRDYHGAKLMRESLMRSVEDEDGDA